MKAAKNIPGPLTEGLIWLSALIALAALDPLQSDAASLCFSQLTGLGNCPGCGLGTSIALLLQGAPAASLAAHPLGIIVVPALLWRILTIFMTAPAKRWLKGDFNGSHY